jgi:hypothetical protein
VITFKVSISCGPNVLDNFNCPTSSAKGNAKRFPATKTAVGNPIPIAHDATKFKPFLLVRICLRVYF